MARTISDVTVEKVSEIAFKCAEEETINGADSNCKGNVKSTSSKTAEESSSDEEEDETQRLREAGDLRREAYIQVAETQERLLGRRDTEGSIW